MWTWIGGEVVVFGSSHVCCASLSARIMLELISSSSSQSPSFKAVIVKSVPLPVSGGWLNNLARSAPRPLEACATMRSADGIRDASARGSGVRLFPIIPYRRRSTSMRSLYILATIPCFPCPDSPQILFEATGSKVCSSWVCGASKQPRLRAILIHCAIMPSVSTSEDISTFCQLLPTQSIEVQ